MEIINYLLMRNREVKHELNSSDLGSGMGCSCASKTRALKLIKL